MPASFAFFVARRLSLRGGAAFARSVGQLAVISAGLGTALMFCAVCILSGFRTQVRNRVVSLGGHLIVQKLTGQEGEQASVSMASPFFTALARHEVPGIARYTPYVTKPALARTPREAEGLVLKGIGPGFDSAAFRPMLLHGRLPRAGGPSTTDSSRAEVMEITLSARQTARLQSGIDSTLTLFFLQDPPRIRRARVVGIYQTGLEEYDETVALTPAPALQQINGWADSLYTGAELYTKDFDRLDEVHDSTLVRLDYDLGLARITDMQVQIFDWLSVIGRNVQIMLILICLVACFNTAGTLLIFMLEKLRTIGLLAALGASRSQVGWVFWWLGLRLAGVGLLGGNVLGALLCLIQARTHLVPLDPDNYYVSSVPIGWPVGQLIGVNLALIAAIALALILPAQVAGRTSPVQAMRK